MSVKAITSTQEFHDVIKGDKIAVIDCWATWCGPCKMISPIFEKLAEGEAASKIAFYKLDVDEQEEVAQEIGVKAMPTFYFFKDGQKIDEVKGAVPAALTEAIKKHSS